MSRRLNRGTHPGTARERARDPVLDDEELREIWHATGGSGAYDAIVRLLILTGQRREEVAGMRWSELDAERTLWRIPAERTENGRPHEVPLLLQARAAPEARIGRALAYLERHYWKDPNGDGAAEHGAFKHELEWLLVRTPASSPEGKIAKMECLMVGDADYGLEPEDVTNIESALMLSVIRDLRAMTEAARRGGRERTPAPSEAGGSAP